MLHDKGDLQFRHVKNLFFKIFTNLLCANKLQVAHNNLTPVFFCSSRARSVISSKFLFDSARVAPSGATSLEFNGKMVI